MAKFPLRNVMYLMQRCLSPDPVVASASSPLASTSFTVEYLVKSCLLPLESAIAASQKIHLKEGNIQRYDSVLNLFKSHGFDHTHIATMMERYPYLLHQYRVDENLKPKLEYLVQNGFSGSHLRELIVSNPRILTTSLSGHIKPSLEYLRSILGTEERVRSAVTRDSRLLSNDLKGTLQPNIDLLVKEGVPLDMLTNFLITQPHLLQSKVDRLVSALKAVKDQLGMDPRAPMYLTAVTTIACFSVSLCEKKMQVLMSFGFTRAQVLSIFRRAPNCFTRSEETLRTKLEFYLDTVKLKLDDILPYPILLSYAIDSRARPRHNVLKLLLSKNLLKEDAKLAYIFTISDHKFLHKYVIAHLQQVPNLLGMYNNDKIAKKIGT